MTDPVGMTTRGADSGTPPCRLEPHATAEDAPDATRTAGRSQRDPGESSGVSAADADVIQLPATGWCVRPGVQRAHWLYLQHGRHMSACGSVERLEFYVPQRLRPLQSTKEHCAACERALQRERAIALL